MREIEVKWYSERVTAFDKSDVDSCTGIVQVIFTCLGSCKNLVSNLPRNFFVTRSTTAYSSTLHQRANVLRLVDAEKNKQHDERLSRSSRPGGSACGWRTNADAGGRRRSPTGQKTAKTNSGGSDLDCGGLARNHYWIGRGSVAKRRWRQQHLPCRDIIWTADAGSCGRRRIIAGGNPKLLGRQRHF